MGWDWRVTLGVIMIGSTLLACGPDRDRRACVGPCGDAASTNDASMEGGLLEAGPSDATVVDAGLFDASTCEGQCPLDAVRCDGDGRSHCRVRPGGCRDWGAAEACGEGMSCSGGVCHPTDSCTDECEIALCDALTLRPCGDYDADACHDLGPEVSCASGDPCLEDSCAPTGCSSTARTCDTPPPSECVDSVSLRTYGPDGTCGGSGCTYPSAESICTFGCASGACNTRSDTWTPVTDTGAPAARAFHSAVWTGTEMIIWGGIGNGAETFSSGGRYSPSTDSWRPVSSTLAPSPRFRHTAVWTGDEMIVWGGESGSHFTDDPQHTGARYDPATDTWVPLPTTGAPSGRFDHAAVWTGTEMIIWGGTDSDDELGTGARYDPLTDSWTPVSMEGAPLPRSGPAGIYSGTEMIVWGGVGGAAGATGGRYRPATDDWSALPTTGAPSLRARHTAVWTGAEMIIWGGWAGVSVDTGARYRTASDDWRGTPSGPAARSLHTAVWTGALAIVWGGAADRSKLDTGSFYEPATFRWTALTTTGAPSARDRHTAIFTGREMIVWGGFAGGYLSTGGRYTP